MKKIYRMLSLVLIVCCLISTVNASAIGNEISYEELVSIVTEEAIRRGIGEVEFGAEPDYFHYTYEELENELDRMFVEFDNLVNNSLCDHTTNNNSAKNPVTRAMPGTVSCSKTHSCSTGEKIENTVNVYVDYNLDTITGIGSPSVRITAGVNLGDYIKLKSYSYSTNNSSSTISNRNVNVSITVELKSEYSIGGVNVWSYFDHSYLITLKPFA